MSNTVQESIGKIRESFRTIKTTAERAAVKFKEEGKPFIEARRNLSTNSDVWKSIDSACCFFSDAAKKYSDESPIDKIITDPKTEKEKALRDYYMYQLIPYTKLDENAADTLENKPRSLYGVSGVADERAIVSVNDYVRLVTSEPYKAYINGKNFNSNASSNQPKKPIDYSMTREQKKSDLLNIHLNEPIGNDLRKLKANKEKGYRKASTIDFLSPADAYDVGLGIGGIICIILAALAAIVLIVAVIIGKIPFYGLVSDAPQTVNVVLTIMLLVVGLAIYGAIAYFAGMFLVGILFFIGSVIIDLLIALIWPISAIVVAIINSKREKSHLEYYNERIAKFQKEFDQRVEPLIEKELADWEKRRKDYDIAIQNYTYHKAQYERTKDDIVNNYRKEVARVAATSMPIIKSCYQDLLTIKEHVGIIKKERTNLYIKLNVKFDYEEAKKCYELLDEGYVSTYDQAIAMVKNMKKADDMREQARIEQKRKEREEEQKRWEQERLARERAEQYERERKEQERIKKEKMEEERREEERIKRIEDAIYEAKMAQRQQTNAILRAALAEIKTMNDQNDLIDQNNKLLEDLKRDLS